jgi:uncharacterized protein YndB with AHSA1/START domain
VARAASVRRTLPASPEEVYAEWTDPQAMAEWMCPRPARCTSVTLVPRVGGDLRLEIEENGTAFAVWGRFRVLDPPHRLEFTWSCSTWPDPTVESIVTVTLEAAGGDETVMTIEHRGFPAELVPRHEAGWEAIATQLAAAGRSGCA